MKTRIFTVVILVPALSILTTTPAHAIFGSILAGIQRAQMIINQGVQIYEAQIAKLTMDGQLSELTRSIQPPAGSSARQRGGDSRNPFQRPGKHAPLQMTRIRA